MLLRLLPIVQIETIVVRSPENHPIWCFPSWTCYGQLPSRIMAVRTILGGISNAVYPGTGAFPRGACCERGGLSRGFMKSEWGRRTFYWIKLQETSSTFFPLWIFPLFARVRNGLVRFSLVMSAPCKDAICFLPSFLTVLAENDYLMI